MRFWSAGLGRRSELHIACGTETPERRDRELVLVGTVRSPVTWEYTITMDGASWEEIVDIGLAPEFARFIASRPHRWRLLALLGWLTLRFAASFVLAVLRKPARTQTVLGSEPSR